MPKRKIEQVEQDESEGFYGNTEGSESTDDSSNQSSNSGENYVWVWAMLQCVLITNGFKKKERHDTIF